MRWGEGKEGGEMGEELHADWPADGRGAHDSVTDRVGGRMTEAISHKGG